MGLLRTTALPLLLVTAFSLCYWPSVHAGAFPHFDSSSRWIIGLFRIGVLSAGDFDKDGHLDLIVPSSIEYTSPPRVTLVVLLGDGEGRFRMGSALAEPIDVHEVHSADLDGDGRLDLVVVGSSLLLFYRGNADGTFGSPLIGSLTNANLVLGDISGDGRPDMVARSDDAKISIFINSGKGGFTSPPPIFLPAPATALSLARLDSDVNLDLVVALKSEETSEVRTYRNAGDGSFGLADSTRAPFVVNGIAAADLEGDGIDDVISWTTTSPGIAVFHGGGNTDLGTLQNVPTDGGLFLVLPADVNGDRRADLIACSLKGTVSTLVGTEGGGFQVASSTPCAQCRTGVSGDWNEDGLQDAVLGGYYGVQLYDGRADGRLGCESYYSSGGRPHDDPQGIATGDLNGDGVPDIVCNNPAAGNASVFLGNGDGDLDPARVYPIAPPSLGPSTRRFALADMNGDLIEDVVTVVQEGNDRSVVLTLFGDKLASLESRKEQRINLAVIDFAVGDLDADGMKDLVCVHADSLTIWKGSKDGSFVLGSTLATSASPSRVTVADSDGDHDADVLVVDASANVMSIFLNDGSGGFAPRVEYSIFTPRQVQVADVTGDGVPDLVAESVGRLALLPGTGHGNFGPMMTLRIPPPIRSGNGSGLRIADLDGDSMLDFVVSRSSTVDVYLSSDEFALDARYGAGGFGDVEIADLDGNGTPDLVSAFSGSIAVMRNRSPEAATRLSGVSAVADLHRAEVRWQSTFAVGTLARTYRREISNVFWTPLHEMESDEGGSWTMVDSTVTPGTYKYRLSVGGRILDSPEISIPVPAALEVRVAGENPTAGRAKLALSIPSVALARLLIFDARGRQVWGRTIRPAGPGGQVIEVEEAQKWRAGVYLARLSQDNQTATGKLVVLP